MSAIRPIPAGKLPGSAFFMGKLKYRDITSDGNNTSRTPFCQKGLQFINHETNEFIDPIFVKELHEMIADGLFRLWISDKKRNRENIKNFG